MLTNQQITALVLGILLPMILLLIAAYAGGLSKGRQIAEAVEFGNGYQAGLSKQSQHITSLLQDIGTLNQRIHVLTTALDLEQAEHQESRSQLSATRDEYRQQADLAAALGTELDSCRRQLLSNDEYRAIARATTLLLSESRRFTRTGTSKTNQAAKAHAALFELLKRRQPALEAAA